MLILKLRNEIPTNKKKQKMTKQIIKVSYIYMASFINKWKATVGVNHFFLFESFF